MGPAWLTLKIWESGVIPIMFCGANNLNHTAN